MSVTLRGSNFQAYVQVNGQRLRKSFKTKMEAEKWEAEARLALTAGKSVPTVESSAINLDQMFRKTQRQFWRGKASEEKQMSNAKRIMEFFGSNVSISEVSTQKIVDFIEHLQDQEKSNATINRHLATLSKALHYASDLGMIDKVPKIHRQEEGVGRLRWLTKHEEDQVLTLLDQWSQSDVRDAVIVSLDTGCRLGELNKLTAEDLLPEGVFLADRKAGNHSVIPLTARAREVLLRRAQDHQGKLFPYRGYWIRTTWERVKTKLGLQDVVWHTLRHTTCSRLVQRGMPLMHVKEWMGHKTIQTTMRYSHLSVTHLSNGVSLLEQ